MDRFWSKVDKTENCWLWTAAINDKGYGVFSRTRKEGPILAHRYSFLLANGYLPDWKQDRRGVLHTCDTPSCVNPNHLRDGSHSENMQESWDRLRTKPTHCPKGHAYEGHNVYLTTTGRTCRICHNERTYRYKRRKKETDNV